MGFYCNPYKRLMPRLLPCWSVSCRLGSSHVQVRYPLVPTAPGAVPAPLIGKYNFAAALLITGLKPIVLIAQPV